MPVPGKAPESKPTITLAGPGGKSLPLDVRAEGSNRHGRYRVLVTPDGLRAFLEYERLDQTYWVLPQDLAMIVDAAGIRCGIDNVALAILADFANLGEKWSNPFQVAQGRRPCPGQDGWVQFHVQPTSREPRYKADEQGKIDYRQLNFFENAMTGQHVATIHPPGAGVPGEDVLGNERPAKDGQPALVRFGRGVRLGNDGAKLFAEEDGRLIFESNVISLVGTYVVEGDVDLKVGNVNFVGEVVIKGGVLDEFQVHGAKGVTIHGTVGASEIISGADLTITGGVAGKGQAFLQTAGALQARYIDEARVEAQGDVIVRNEVVNSTLYTKGKLSIPDGTIIGGEIIAFKGIEAGTIGSALGVWTKVSAGVDYDNEQRLRALENQIQERESRCQQANELLAPLLTNREQLGLLPPENRKQLAELINRLREMRDELGLAKAELDKCLNQRIEGQICQINVHNQLYPGSEVRFPGVFSKLQDSYRGPLSVTEDLRRQRVCYVELRPLKPTDESPEDDGV